jgi:hypothetical protein
MFTFMKYFPDYLLQTFDDKGKDKSLVTYGKPNEAYMQRLKELNSRGAGIFFTPNSFPSGTRKKEQCERVNAWFFEVDDVSIDDQWKRIKEAPLMPSLIVQTRKSLHCYYLATDATIENFEKIQRGLIQHFEADPACKDITRVLRIPGFYHNKKEPYEVKIVHDKGNYYEEKEMLETFPVEEKKQTEVKQDKKKNSEGFDFWEAASRLDNKTILQRLSGSHMVNHESFTFRERTSGGEYIDVNGEPADAWIDQHGKIGSGKKGGPTYIQWLQFYGWSKGDIAKWIKKECADLLPKSALKPKKGEKNGGVKEEKQTVILLSIFEQQNPVLFRNEMDEAYVQIDIDSKKKIVKCESNAFEKYLHKLYWEETDELIGSDGLGKVVKLLAAKAEYGSEKYQLFNRVALCDNDFWFDLGGEKVIRCRIGSWEIIEDLPILFRHYQHQETQVLPEKNGDIKGILDHVRIKKEEQQVLFLVWLVSCFVPEIPHPILVLFGEKGSAKSTTMRFTRQIVDPSKADLLTLPGKDELVQQLAHHYTAFYDNVNRINQMTSDVLCRAVTGAGASKRRLFTDDDDVIYKYRRIIAVNGINNVVQSADLLDRSILVELERIPKNERRTEAELNNSFKGDIQSILSGVFNTLAKARTIFDDLEIESFPRMADFAKWGYAIAEALGFGGDLFVRAYEANINQQNDEVLENDPVAHTLCCFMEDQEEWEGSPTELHDQLLGIATNEKIPHKYMPKTPASLGKRINIVLSNLLEAGIEIERMKDTGGKRGRTYKITKTIVALVAESSEPESVSDSSVGSDSSDSKKQVEKVHTVENFKSGKCVLGDLSSDDQEKAVKQQFEI